MDLPTYKACGRNKRGGSVAYYYLLEPAATCMLGLNQSVALEARASYEQY